MSQAIFLRLLPYDDKASVLDDSIQALQNGRILNSIVYVVDPASFGQIPGSTFAYWVNEGIRRIFTELSPFESEGRTVKQGLATADDFRFVRLWWEVRSESTTTGTSQTSLEQFHQQTFLSRRWVPFAKGGAYSPYYSDLHLVVNWEQDGEEIKARINPETGRPYSNVWQLKGTEQSFFFRRGLTWPRRTDGLSFRILPGGCIFGDKGPAVFVASNSQTELLALATVMNSQSFYLLVKMLVARVSLAQSFEAGLIQSIPIPNLSNADKECLCRLAYACLDLKRSLDSSNECSHGFRLPALLGLKGETLFEHITAWQKQVDEIQYQLAKNQREIDAIAFDLYGIKEADLQVFEGSVESGRSEAGDIDQEILVEDQEDIPKLVNTHELIFDLISYIIGCSFGRWDVRFATGKRLAPELPDPFAPLLVCSAGMLISDDGLPLRESPAGYPLEINWEGIVVDDPDHSDDIVRCVRDVLVVIWKDNAEAIEQEACQVLGVKELRDYFRRPGNDGFWMDHVKRYSKSRRKAPIYWLLQSSKRNYALWLYYHRLDKDILFKALTNYVEPKLRLEESRLAQLRAQLTGAGSAGRAVKQLEKQLERQEGLMAELYDFRDKLRRAADLQLVPDLNDGVVLNIAPLWELVPWSEARKYWEELRAGKYEWSSISKQLRERKVI